MSFNPFKPLIQNIQELFLSYASNNDEREDEKMECLQFGMYGDQVKRPRSEELFFG